MYSDYPEHLRAFETPVILKPKHKIKPICSPLTTWDYHDNSDNTVTILSQMALDGCGMSVSTVNILRYRILAWIFPLGRGISPTAKLLEIFFV